MTQITIKCDPILGITSAVDSEGNMAAAICHPDDVFDKQKGIQLALQRLITPINYDDTVFVKPDEPSKEPFLEPRLAEYIINYLVVRIGVLPGAYLDKIDWDPQCINVKTVRPVQYTLCYETGEGWSVVENKLTGKIAVTKPDKIVKLS